jgi:hypothetical protein
MFIKSVSAYNGLKRLGYDPSQPIKGSIKVSLYDPGSERRQEKVVVYYAKYNSQTRKLRYRHGELGKADIRSRGDLEFVVFR